MVGLMGESNLERMIKLAEEFFQTKNDPAQISINEQSMARLLEIHPATVTEKKDDNGPVAWMIVIPTTQELMEKFISGEADERDILDDTPLGIKYDALYLCSALVLPEYRLRGLARELIVRAVRSIREQHPIGHLFYWAFSEEGRKLASSVARECSLPLSARAGD